MKSEELPINISGHIEWGVGGGGGGDGQLEIRTFSLGMGTLLPKLREVHPCRGTLLKMVPVA